MVMQVIGKEFIVRTFGNSSEKSLVALSEIAKSVADFSSSSSEKTSHIGSLLEPLNENGPHCSEDALTDSFGWFVQGVLACLAFMLLILKRFCEPRRYRRQWIIWFYDTSKQGFGALVIHFANVFLASMFHGDPCTWYIVSFLLDSSAGLFIIFIGIRTSQWLAKYKGWSSFNFGEYGKPPLWRAWLIQSGLYIFIMVIEKILMTCLIQLDFWNDVRMFILAPIKDPKLEVAIVVLVIPFVINAIMFWVVDNFLMRKRQKTKDDYVDAISERRKIRYKKMDRKEDSESEILLSADDESANAVANNEGNHHFAEVVTNNGFHRQISTSSSGSVT